MHPESIEQKIRATLDKIAKEKFARPFYLASGTALAIHLGHQFSVDLDFFTQKPFSVSTLRDAIARLGSFRVEGGSDANTLVGILDQVQVSFFLYPYKNIYSFVPFAGIMLADERDIAAMKVDAISTRGSKKDFVDFYFLLKRYSLQEIIGFFETRFHHVAYNRLHILKSLSYFEDAEGDPMPMMLHHVPWEEMKRVISDEAKKLAG